jgi:SpoVK/Ycf46/Vps4 family AAA+-type ATPase
MTTGYSGSDLKTMCREAAMSVVRDSLAARDGKLHK